MTTFLSPDEIERLTGRRQRNRQVEYLRANRWRFVQDAHGRILIARAYFERRMVGAEAPDTPQARVEPDFSAV